MWNCSAPPSLLLPFGDDYLKCESSGSSQVTGAAGLDGMLAADYDLCRTLNQSSQSLQSLEAPMIFPLHGSGCYLGASSLYNGEAVSPASAHPFDCTTTQPTAAPAAAHSVKWTAARETVTTGDGSRGSKRLKTRTTTAATAQGPHTGLQRNAARPRNQPPVKTPCKRSQKLGDKITALQQLVSPYGKTDTASVLQEVAFCIKHLHQQIQILTASYPDVGSPTSHKDTDGDEGGATDLRRRGLCVAPLSPAVVEFVSSAAARDHRDMADTGDCWRQLGTL